VQGIIVFENEVPPLVFVKSRIDWIAGKIQSWRLKMKKRFVDEKTGIPYTLVGDYYLP
jgi:hypothetical protein